MSRTQTPGRGETGSASIEAAVAVPAFVLLVGLILLGGRTALAHQALESAAADAARSASLARTSQLAREEAMQAATTSLANQQVQCVRIDVRVDTSGFAAPLGRDATVEVTIECLLDLADLAIPGVPGRRILRSTMTSPLDSWRERA